MIATTPAEHHALQNSGSEQPLFRFSTQAYPNEPFAVVSLEGFEAISQLFRFTLLLVTQDEEIDFDRMLQHAARISIFPDAQAEASDYHGILADFEQLHRIDGFSFYRATLVPRLWRLSRYTLSEAYTGEQSIPQLIAALFDKTGFTHQDYLFKIHERDYRPRSFVYQYEESYLNFIARWLEKEGLFYVFDHSQGQDQLILVDSTQMLPSGVLPLDYRPHDALDTGVAGNVVQDFICRQQPLPNKLQLRGFNHRKASAPLNISTIIDPNGIGEVMLYGENYRDETEGQRYIRLRAEEMRASARVYSGSGRAFGLRSGYFIELRHHFRDSFNQRYLVTEVRHQGSQSGALLNGNLPQVKQLTSNETHYHCEFQAISSQTPYRAPRASSKPKVAGTLNAIIDAEGSGQCAELDEYGQYKVRLVQDYSDKAPNCGSARVRMASPYAGSENGMHFPLRKGTEVLLSFIDGDPDQPVILSAVVNSENPSLIEQNTASLSRIRTPSGQGLYMSDQSGTPGTGLYSSGSLMLASAPASPNTHGMWIGTSGSSQSLTLGLAETLQAGGKTTIATNWDVGITAGIVHSIALGTSTKITAGADVAWKWGKTFTLDDSSSVSLSPEGKLKGVTSVSISAGANPVIASTMASAQKAMKAAIAANALATIGGALGSAMILKNAADDTGKFKPWDGSATWKSITTIGAPTTAAASITSSMLGYYARTLDGLTKDANYFSKLKMDSDGISLSYSLLPPNKASLAFDETCAISMASIFGPQKASLTLDSMKGYATLTASPTSKIEVDLFQGVTLTGSPTSKIEVAPLKGVTLTGSPTTSANVGSGKIQLNVAEAQLLMNPISATLKFGDNKLSTSLFGINMSAPASVKINGAIIQLG